MNASTLVPIAALLCYSVLLAINIWRIQRGQISYRFSFYLLSMIVWSLGSFLAHFEHPRVDTLFWNRFMLVGSTGMPFAFFGFVVYFLRKPRKYWLICGSVLYIAILIANVFGYVIASAEVSEGKLINVYGPAIALPSISWVLFIGLSAWDLLEEYRRTKDVNYRNRIKYLFSVILVIFLGSITNATSLGVYPVDIAFNVVSAFLIAYAILRYQLIDFSVVMRKSLLYSIPTIIISVVYFVFLYLIWQVIGSFSNNRFFLVSLLFAVLSAFVAQPIRDRAQLLVDRLVFRDKHDVGLMLQRISRTAASFLEIKDLTEMIMQEITAHIHVSKSAILLRSIDKNDFLLSSQHGLDPDVAVRFREDHPVVQWLEANGHVLTQMDIDINPQFMSLWGQERDDLNRLEAELFIPIKIKNRLAGILVAGPKRSGETFSPDEHQVLIALADQTAVAIENARLYAEAKQRTLELKQLSETLRQQAIRDPLTHLFNRRYMEETLERELARAGRNQSPLGIIFIDIDHFKRFNDQYGHDAGDHILQDLGRFLLGQVRKEDIACRYGGEEFVLILPETPLDVLYQRAEAVRVGAKLLGHCEDQLELDHLTLSIGLAVYPQHGTTTESLLRSADAALYHAKAKGRDCILVAD